MATCSPTGCAAFTPAVSQLAGFQIPRRPGADGSRESRSSIPQGHPQRGVERGGGVRFQVNNKRRGSTQVETVSEVKERQRS